MESSPGDGCTAQMTTAEKATVLIVEDQSELADAYTAILSLDYEVKTAYSGDEALELVDETVDVVLLDRRMPGMAGDEVLARLKKQGITAKVAMLTAVEPDTDIVEMPFDDYRTKPINNNELQGLVETLLRWAEYDKHSQRFFRLAAKKKALEAGGKELTEEYTEILAKMKETRKQVDATLEELSAETTIDNLDPLV